MIIRPSNSDIIDAIYPIGAIFITSQKVDICPLQALGHGTWKKISAGRVLQGADTTSKAGSTVEAGLPNIKGQVGTVGEGVLAQQQSKKFMPNGAFYGFENQGANVANNSGDSDTLCFMDASRYNPIYKDSCNTVQPPAYLVNIFERVS